MKGNISVVNGDTIFEGQIQYYDSSNKIVEVSEFQKNKRNGESVVFYPNGHVRQISTYIAGYKNGQSIAYNNVGKIVKKNNKYFGLDMGPVEFYQNDSLRAYEFLSVDGYPIYRAEYDSGKGLLETGRLLCYVSTFSDDNKFRRIKIFLYLINPPGKALTYKIFDADLKSRDTFLVNTFNSDQQTFAIFYVNLPKKNHKYLFKIEALYSNSGRVVENILKPEESDLVLPGAR